MCFQIIYPDFDHLVGSASLPLCTLPHFNTCELQRFTSWVALLAGFSLGSKQFYSTLHMLF